MTLYHSLAPGDVIRHTDGRWEVVSVEACTANPIRKRNSIERGVLALLNLDTRRIAIGRQLEIGRELGFVPRGDG